MKEPPALGIRTTISKGYFDVKRCVLVCAGVSAGGLVPADNRILRAHLRSRLRLSDREGSTLAEIGKRPGREILAQEACVAKPFCGEAVHIPRSRFAWTLPFFVHSIVEVHLCIRERSFYLSFSLSHRLPGDRCLGAYLPVGARLSFGAMPDLKRAALLQ